MPKKPTGTPDSVNHPSHYTQHPSGVECIQITEHMGFCLGNAVKYIWRADLKHDAIEDLKKARWYVDREIARREKGGMTDAPFKLPTAPFRLPTDEEVKEWTLPSWEAVQPTLLSGLHPALLRLTIPTMFFSIPMTEVNPLWLECFDGKDNPQAFRRIVECGREALSQFPEGVFFKLDSRSPKDWGIVRYTAENIDELPGHFFSSERMLDDLVVQRHHRDAIVLCFRQWVDLGEEYRVFVKDRQIQGITRYDYRAPPKREHTQDVVRSVESEVARYLGEINPHFPLDNFVFDLGMTGDTGTLIEINPYGLSDPCLFKSYANIRGFVA